MVSVIIPLFNRENTIYRSIQSVLQQTYNDIEVIVVDDGSTDESVDIVRKIVDKRVKLIVLDHNYGAGYARNIGIENAQGEYIAFQDSDDEWHINKLEKQLEYIIENKYDMVFSSYNQHHLDGDVKRIPMKSIERQVDKGDCITKILTYTNIVGTPTILLSKEVIKKIGGFDITLPKLQDYEFVIRIAKSFKIGYLRESLVEAYIQENSLTMKPYDNVAWFIIIKKHFDFVDKKQCLRNLIFSGFFDQDGYMDIDKIAQFDNVSDEVKSLLLEILYEDYKKIFSLRRSDYKAYVDRLHNGVFGIYGAGEIGIKVYKDLQKQDLSPAFFIVTRKKNNEHELFGIPIVQIDEVTDKQLDIIVAVGRKYQNEIYDTLELRGFTSFMAYGY